MQLHDGNGFQADREQASGDHPRLEAGPRAHLQHGGLPSRRSVSPSAHHRDKPRAGITDAPAACYSEEPPRPGIDPHRHETRASADRRLPRRRIPENSGRLHARGDLDSRAVAAAARLPRVLGLHRALEGLGKPFAQHVLPGTARRGTPIPVDAGRMAKSAAIRRRGGGAAGSVRAPPPWTGGRSGGGWTAIWQPTSGASSPSVMVWRPSVEKRRGCALARSERGGRRMRPCRERP